MLKRTGWPLSIAAIGLICCVLSFHGASDGAPPRAGGPPFANSVEQRMEMIKELGQIRLLMKEQNELLQAQNELLKKAYPELKP